MQDIKTIIYLIINKLNLLFQVKYTGTVKSNYESLVTKRYPGTRFTPIKVNSQWQTVFKKVLPMVSPEKLKEKLNFDVEDLVFIAIGKEEYVVSK